MKPLTGIVLFFSMLVRSSEPSWLLSKDEDGIKIYTSSNPAYAVKGIKAELEFDAALPQVLAVVMDVANYKNWVYSCAQSRILKQVSKSELIYYHITDAPWPATDRDLVSKFTAARINETSVEITSGHLPDYLPVQEEYVRVKRTEASWKFTQLPNGKVKAEYRLFIDPGGSVPAWMMNLFITDGPYQSMLKMKKEVKRDVYAKAKMDDYF